VEAKPLQRPRPLAPAALEFAWEKVLDFIGEARGLLEQNDAETGLDPSRYPLDFDLRSYAGMEAAGALRILTARSNGALVGYVALIVTTLLHHKTVKKATIDTVWLHPLYRSGWNGVRLIQWAEDEARRLGAEWIELQPQHNGVEIILKRLGWRHADRPTFTKDLRDAAQKG